MERLHVDEAWILLLNLLKLLIGRKRHSFRVRADADEVRDDLNRVDLEGKQKRL